ncbi:hypothetical protein JCM10207_003370 [Rhodosporidiobolus poonsookiae]
MAVPKLVTFDASAPLEEMVAVMKRDGGLIVRNFLSAENLEEMQRVIVPLVDASTVDEEDGLKEVGEGFVPSHTKRVYGLLGCAPVPISKVIQDKVWQGLMGTFLSAEVQTYTGKQLVVQKTGFQLNATVAVTAMPGSTAQALHRDQVLHAFQAEENSLKTSMVGCLIALSDITEENGGTAVIPGSHLWPPSRAPDESECTYTEMAAGSALFTLGSVYHGADANRSKPSSPNSTRTLINVFGTHDWLRQEENMYATVPLEVARTLPEEVLRLSGWAKGAGGCGFVNHRDPIDFIHKPELEKMSLGFAPVATA